jgi:hypothetical protein
VFIELPLFEKLKPEKEEERTESLKVVHVYNVSRAILYNRSNYYNQLILLSGQSRIIRASNSY